MTTWLDIVDTALIRIGSQPLQSIDAPQASERKRIYDSVAGSILGGHPWTFCRRTRELVRQGVAPVAHWKYSYGLDPEMLGPPRAAYDSADRRTPYLDWEIFAGANDSRVLVTDAERIWLRYTVIAGPDAWHLDVREMITVAMMAEFALTVREDRPLYDRLRETVYGPANTPGEAGMIAMCKAKDAMGEPSPEIAGGSNPLVDVRRAVAGVRVGRWDAW